MFEVLHHLIYQVYKDFLLETLGYNFFPSLFEDPNSNFSVL